MLGARWRRSSRWPQAAESVPRLFRPARTRPMDAPPSPLFRQVAVEAASGTQIGASLSTHWRGVPVFTAIAAVLLAALIAFVAVVEYAPVHRVAAFVDARAGPAAAGESVQGCPPALAITPAREPLVVKFLIPSAAVSSVRPGVVVKLAFRDYPRERFGVFETKVESVDAVPSLPGSGRPGSRERHRTDVRSPPRRCPAACTRPRRSAGAEARHARRRADCGRAWHPRRMAARPEPA